MTQEEIGQAVVDAVRATPTETRCRVFLIGGSSFDAVSADTWPILIQQIRINGGLMTPQGYTPLSSIISIANLATQGSGPNVVPLHGGTQTAGQA